MFNTLDKLPPDPILGLSQQYLACQHPEKVNLGVGVYQTDQGITPIFSAVKRAEQTMIDEQQSKVYIAQQGDTDFLSGMQNLLLGTELAKTLADRNAIVMTPGGCGGIRVAAEVIQSAKPGATIWLSNPTWGNHYPLLESSGLSTKQYAYYDLATGNVDFNAMLADLSKVPAGDIVLFHACCHNPTGADLNKQQWQQVIDQAQRNSFTPFFDIAYQGFSESLDDDAFAIRLAAKTLEEIIVVSSCSKNFGLYRERVGSTLFINKNSKDKEATLTHAIATMRRSYTMSPYHGGGIVGRILNDAELTKAWQAELTGICAHIKQLRQQFTDLLNAKQSRKDFSFIVDNQGMFSYLGIELEQVLQLRKEYGIYFLDSTRVNIAGLSSNNIDYTSDAIAAVLNQ